MVLLITSKIRMVTVGWLKMAQVVQRITHVIVDLPLLPVLLVETHNLVSRTVQGVEI